MGTVNVNSIVPVIELWQDSNETVVYQQDTDVSFVCVHTVPDNLCTVYFHMTGAGRILWRALLQQMALAFLKYIRRDGCATQHT